MIELGDLKNRNAITILETYDGRNPYIRRLKRAFLSKNVTLTENQLKYIADNYNKPPLKMDKIVEITPFLGEELKKQDDLKFVPTKILVEYLLAETEKAFHVYGKLKRNQDKSKMYWISKTQLIDDMYFDKIDVEVDFDKYVKLDTKHRIPYNHQKEGVKFLLARDNSILADDMGLGKTYEAIVAALECEAKKILIICPASVKINWEKEINLFDDDTQIVSSKKWKTSKFTIINYDILKNFHTIKKRGKSEETEEIVVKTQLLNAEFDLVIIDESHFIKNPKSNRAKIISDLCLKGKIERVWLLTGTPITNRPMDYYNLLKVIKAPIAENWVFFAKRYCAARKFFKTLKTGQRKQIWLTDGASNLEELAIKTKNIILRRTKEEALDMPDKTITPIFHELDNVSRVEYERLWDEYIEKRREEGKSINIQRDLTEIILLRQFIAQQAIPHTIELAESAIDQGHKVVIFTNFTKELLELANHFDDSAVLHYGKMTSGQKENSIERFQNDPKVKVFIGNILSAGVGINLTESDIVIFNSFDWVPANNFQCEDRCYRIGQKNNVTVYYHLFMKTISTYMWKVLFEKKTIIATVMNDNRCTEDEAMKIILKDELNYENGS